MNLSKGNNSVVPENEARKSFDPTNPVLTPGEVKTRTKAVTQMTLEDVKLDYVSQIYLTCNKRIGETARVLGIGRSTLYRYLKQLGM